MIKAVIFDWGNTVMRDFPEKPGAMVNWDHVELISGIDDVLRFLSEEYIVCIASNAGCSDTSLMIAALRRVGVDKYFHHFFTSKDLGFQKPDKRFFTSITSKINVLSSECIMVGDSYEKDICGAKTVGMKTILFNEKNIFSSFPDADMVVISMKDLYNAIGYLNQMNL